MWENLKRGGAEFRANGWRLAVTSGDQGVQLVAHRQGWAASAGRIWMPESRPGDCRESFIRGDALHLSLSDTETQPLGLELVLMAIEADQSLLIIESVVAVNTSLLDSHPAVELQLAAGPPSDPRWGDRPWSAQADQGPAHWLQAQPSQPSENSMIATCVVCDERDTRSLDTAALADGGKLRFFGDFLEKGVIRKVQPWWIWSQGPVPAGVATRIAKQLASRPLPLTN